MWQCLYDVEPFEFPAELFGEYVENGTLETVDWMIDTTQLSAEHAKNLQAKSFPMALLLARKKGDEKV